jgi:hypothetical protein
VGVGVRAAIGVDDGSGLAVAVDVLVPLGHGDGVSVGVAVQFTTADGEAGGETRPFAVQMSFGLLPRSGQAVNQCITVRLLPPSDTSITANSAAPCVEDAMICPPLALHAIEYCGPATSVVLEF